MSEQRYKALAIQDDSATGAAITRRLGMREQSTAGHGARMAREACRTIDSAEAQLARCSLCKWELWLRRKQDLRCACRGPHRGSDFANPAGQQCLRRIFDALLDEHSDLPTNIGCMIQPGQFIALEGSEGSVMQVIPRRGDATRGHGWALLGSLKWEYKHVYANGLVTNRGMPVEIARRAVAQGPITQGAYCV